MLRIILIPLIASLIFQACSQKRQTTEERVIQFDQGLADELKQMAEVDQTAAWMRKGKFKDYSLDEWRAYKDSVFRTNKKRAEEIFDKYGYPGFTLVGERGSHDFWLIVQHCDFDPDFQINVLKDMKTEMENGNASKRSYAYLIDRVHKNLGKRIIYGTQVTYNEYGQAISRPLEDSANVNVRRAEMGLVPLEAYLNELTVGHFEMNKANLLNKGITEPKLYKVRTQ